MAAALSWALSDADSGVTCATGAAGPPPKFARCRPIDSIGRPATCRSLTEEAMSERGRMVHSLLRAAGLAHMLASIGRDDDLPWAKFRVGRDLSNAGGAYGDSLNVSSAAAIPCSPQNE